MSTRSYRTIAKLVASKLHRSELINLAELLDADASNDFCHFIQAECKKVAPEIYGPAQAVSKPVRKHGSKK